METYKETLMAIEILTRQKNRSIEHVEAMHLLEMIHDIASQVNSSIFLKEEQNNRRHCP